MHNFGFSRLVVLKQAWHRLQQRFSRVIVLKQFWLKAHSAAIRSERVKDCDGKFHRKLITEEHISIISEPGSTYFGHMTPTAGSSKVIAAELIAYLSKRNVDTSGIKAVGCDGTAANTGNRGGIIRLLEVALHRLLQWFVCQLHANELPLRHLFEYLDGPTNGPKGFSGPIGKSLVNCEKLPVVDYIPINCVLPLSLNPQRPSGSPVTHLIQMILTTY